MGISTLTERRRSLRGFFMRETGLSLATVLHRFDKHAERPNPGAGVVVQRTIKNHGFKRLTVPHDTEHFVLAALVVAIPPERD